MMIQVAIGTLAMKPKLRILMTGNQLFMPSRQTSVGLKTNFKSFLVPPIRSDIVAFRIQTLTQTCKSFNGLSHPCHRFLVLA